jgi:hypothetical protein
MNCIMLQPCWSMFIFWKLYLNLCIKVIALGRVKLRFNFTRVFKVSQIARVAKTGEGNLWNLENTREIKPLVIIFTRNYAITC